MRVRISQNAHNNILDVYDYLCDRHSERLAIDKVAKLYKDIDMLGDHPYMGKSIDGHDKNLRQFYSEPNIIIYDIDENFDVLEILHIANGKENYLERLI